MELITKSLNLKDAQRLLGFFRNAYDDYLASRTLLNHNLILQGTILANTSIEKYFKAILTFKGDIIKHSHSIKGMLPSIKNFDTKLYNKLDKEFIEKVDACYALRYIDSVSENFKITMLKKQILAELDFTISLMHDKINVNKNNGSENKSQYEFDKDSKRIELIENNYLFGTLTKEDFLIGIDDVHEFFIDSNKNFIEIKYQTDVKGNI
jgi:HEPN domain-containing protein